MKGILAKKIGMTRIVSENRFVPVTLLEAPDAFVLQVKSAEKDGYNAAVLGSFDRKKYGKNMNKKYKFIREISLSDGQSVKTGDAWSVDQMTEGMTISVQGTSKGRGFAGVIKRHNFSRGPETHGSHHHREPGSVGMCAKPGQILKGRKFPGHMGNETVTIRKVEVVKVDSEQKLIAVRGGVPGAKNGYLLLIEQE